MKDGPTVYELTCMSTLFLVSITFCAVTLNHENRIRSLEPERTAVESYYDSPVERLGIAIQQYGTE